jgi:hypothetical protein
MLGLLSYHPFFDELGSFLPFYAASFAISSCMDGSTYQFLQAWIVWSTYWIQGGSQQCCKPPIFEFAISAPIHAAAQDFIQFI